MLAIGLLIVDRLIPEPAPAADATSASVAAEGNEDAADNGPDPASIAVLPFADLSPERNQAYFAEGIAEEILNVLVGVDGLAVASRTSSFQFKDQQAIGTREIASHLEVRHVLEGSVRSAGAQSPAGAGPGHTGRDRRFPALRHRPAEPLPQAH